MKFGVLMEAWKASKPEQEVYLLGFYHGDELRVHLEAPWDSNPELLIPQRDHFYLPQMEEQPLESVVRVFHSKKEAEFYRETACAYLDEEVDQSEVIEMTVKELFEQANDLEQRCRAEHDAPLRIDLSTQVAGEFPTTIDIIYSCRDTLH